MQILVPLTIFAGQSEKLFSPRRKCFFTAVKNDCHRGDKRKWVNPLILDDMAEKEKATSQNDERYMARCLELAACGRFGAAPNPMVGAVIVHNGKIIGEGYHRQCGGPHAEVNAVRSVEDERLLREATMYVSLEPCAHYGKTPPCADMIVEKGIPRVVIGCRDSFDQVDGKGIQNCGQQASR